MGACQSTPDDAGAAAPGAGLPASLSSGGESSSSFMSIFHTVSSIHNPERAAGELVKLASELLACSRTYICFFDVESGVYVTLNVEEGGMVVVDELGDAVDGIIQDGFEGNTIVINSQADKAKYDKDLDDSVSSALIVPAADSESRVITLFMCEGKADGARFGEADRRNATHLAYLATFVMKNYLSYKQGLENEIQNRAILDIVKSVNAATPATAMSFIFTVNRRAQELFNAEKCTLFIVDRPRQLLWSATTDSGKQIRIPLSKGIVGAAATEQKCINCPDAYEDPRFDVDYDRQTGFKTKSVLCAPIMTKVVQEGATKDAAAVVKENCVAVIQLINKRKSVTLTFSQEDEDLLMQLCTILGEKMQSNIEEVFHIHNVASDLSQENEANKTLTVGRRRRSITGSIDEGRPIGIEQIIEEE